jgi:hypothetical protein
LGGRGLTKWTSNSCTAVKENSRKSEAETMYVPHRNQDILRGLSSQRPTCITCWADALPTELLTGLSVCQPFF